MGGRLYGYLHHVLSAMELEEGVRFLSGAQRSQMAPGKPGMLNMQACLLKGKDV